MVYKGKSDLEMDDLGVSLFQETRSWLIGTVSSSVSFIPVTCSFPVCLSRRLFFFFTTRLNLFHPW